MKKVMRRDTREVIVIDENAEKDWMSKYLHCSWVEFEAESKIDDVSKPVLTVEEEVEKVLKQLHKKYKIKFEREVPMRYKNDMEWLKGKLVK